MQRNIKRFNNKIPFEYFKFKLEEKKIIFSVTLRWGLELE